MKYLPIKELLVDWDRLTELTWDFSDHSLDTEGVKPILIMGNPAPVNHWFNYGNTKISDNLIEIEDWKKQ